MDRTQPLREDDTRLAQGIQHAPSAATTPHPRNRLVVEVSIMVYEEAYEQTGIAVKTKVYRSPQRQDRYDLIGEIGSIARANADKALTARELV